MSREVICKDCGHVGYPKRLISFRNNFLVSTLLWLLMLPGLLYTVWNFFGGKRKSCSECGSTSVSGLNSAYGKVAMEEIYMKKLSDDIISSENKTDIRY